MSLNKSATHRLSLLAGSSLVAAGLSAFAFTATALAPQVALAANECTPVGVDPAANGAAPDAYACSAATYATGITYGSAGDLAVSKTNTGVTTVTANGVNLTGSGADTVTWDSSIGGVTGGAGTAGPVIDVTSGSGAISITTNTVTANQAGTTHGIRATSTGGGAITITRSAGAVNNNVAGGEAAIEAVTNGGAINITTAGATQGRLRGILAQTGGAGSVTLNLGGNVTASNIDGIAAVDVTAGTGGVNITLASGTINTGASGPGYAIRAATTGNAVINNTAATIGQINFNMPFGGSAVDFSGVAGNVTFTHAGASNTTGRWLGAGDNVFGAGADTLNFLGVGHNFLGGRGALAEASIDFGAGADTLNLVAFLNIGGHTQDAGTIDFGDGVDTFNLSGVFTSHGGTLANLEALNLSGTIFIGTANTGGTNPNVVWDQADGVADDVLRVHGAAFTGSGDARIVMDVDISGGAQAGCETLTGVADCLDLRGGSTAGVTMLTLNNLSDDALQAGYDPIGMTIVDVGGGTSAPEHFVLDPSITGLGSDTLLGDVIDRPGLFRYALRYDPDTQRHVLVGLPLWELYDYAILSGAAQSIWHMTAETVTDRQTERRGGTEGGSVWMRATGEYTQRDAATAFETLADTFAVDSAYKLYSGAVMGGMDLITGRSGGYDYVLGGQIGYVSSSFDLDNAPSSGRFTGAAGGLYGSVWSNRFFLDTTLNGNFLTLDFVSPGLGSRTNTYLYSFGVQAEGGMRAMFGDSLFAEPLATLGFVRTTFEEISLTGGEVQPDDSESLRAALGLRLGAQVQGQSVNVNWFVTGRAWNEFAGESSGVVRNPGLDLPFADELSGGFGEAEAGVNLFNDAGTLSGFLTSGVKFKEGYSAVNLSLGARMAW